ncbi:MAG: GNAT family N-acetyltransferase, partial [Phycisphaerales bacterium]|nr:GNAT family N-acetyltransferase [Phycisphaerales bacterium]
MATWRKLTQEDEIPSFIDAAANLHQPLLDRIPRDERPFFFDAWLTRFNHCDAWRLPTSDGGPALVTVPRVADRHEYRWQVRTLAVGAAAEDTLVLPPEVGVDRSFLMPCPSGQPTSRSVLAEMTATPVQLGLVVRLDDVAVPAPVDWRLHESSEQDMAGILTLLERAYPWLEETASRPPIGTSARFTTDTPDLHRQREELRQLVSHDAGWCFHATIDDDATPVAMASYLALPLPLLGVPAVLTADPAVDPPYRGRGLARTL